MAAVGSGFGKDQAIVISDDEGPEERESNIASPVQNGQERKSTAVVKPEPENTITPCADSPDSDRTASPPLIVVDVLRSQTQLLSGEKPRNQGVELLKRPHHAPSPQLVKMFEKADEMLLEFLESCKKHLTDKEYVVIKEKIRSLVRQTNWHYLASEKFKDNVSRLAKCVRKDGFNVFVYIKELTDELRAFREKRSKPKHKPDSEATALSGDNLDTSSSGITESSSCQSTESKKPNDNTKSGPSAAKVQCPSIPAAPSPSLLNSSASKATTKLSPPLPSVNAVPGPARDSLPTSRDPVCPQPSTSSTADSEKVHHFEPKQEKASSSGEVNCAASQGNGVGSGRDSPVTLPVKEEVINARRIRKLEKHLAKLAHGIKKLREEEVNWDDSDDENSPYIMESRYKARALNVWQKICELQGRRPTTGRERDRKFSFKGTRFDSLNTKVEKLVNKSKIFPDFTDILNLVREENNELGLGLGNQEMKSMARDIFSDVGQELQKRRQRDELSIVRSYLEEDPDFTADPAEHDAELLTKLEANAEAHRKRIDDVIQAYVVKQENMKLEAQEVKEEECNQSPVPSPKSAGDEDEEDDEEENKEDEDIVKCILEGDDDNLSEDESEGGGTPEDGDVEGSGSSLKALLLSDEVASAATSSKDGAAPSEGDSVSFTALKRPRSSPKKGTPPREAEVITIPSDDEDNELASPAAKILKT